MSNKTAAQDRCAAWIAALELYGYAPIEVRWNRRRTNFEIRAYRPHLYGEPAAIVDVSEEWEDGPDPVVHVQRTHHGAYMRAGSAHAQVAPGELGAHRIDIGDPRKAVSLTIHLHPAGKPNDERIALHGMPVPEQWMNQVEEICLQVGLGTPLADVKI
jgi:hypothetical protein